MSMITKYKLFENNLKAQDLIIDLFNSDNTITCEAIKNIKNHINDIMYSGFDILSLLIFREKDSSLIKCAIDAGADINNRIKSSSPIDVNSSISSNGFLRIYDMSPLILATLRGVTYTNIRILIDAGADWYIKDSYGNDFTDYLYDSDKWLSENYPEKYEEFIKYKKASEFNL